MKRKSINIYRGRIVSPGAPYHNGNTQHNDLDRILTRSLQFGDWLIEIKDDKIVVSGLANKSFTLEDGTVTLCSDTKGNNYAFFRSIDLVNMFKKFKIRSINRESPNRRFTYRVNKRIELLSDGEIVRNNLQNTIIFNVTNATFVLEEIIDGDHSVHRVLYTEEHPLALEPAIDAILNKND